VPAGRDPQSRRRRRQARTFVGLVSFVLIAGLIALGNAMHWWTIGGGQERAMRLPCPAETALDPDQVVMGVYNATNRFGLARSVARELQARGFTVTTITNDRSGQRITAAAIVRYGPPGKLAAASVKAQVAGPVTLQDDGRDSRTIDLILGTSYTAMVPRPQASQAIAPVPTPAGCRRVTTSPFDLATTTPAAPARPTPSKSAAAPPAATTPAVAAPAAPTSAPATRAVLTPAPTTKPSP
jgi:hypothetical protein